MAELEEIDLAKALAMLGRRIPWMARDVFTGTDTREQDIEIAEILEQAARLLRERADRSRTRAVETNVRPITRNPGMAPPQRNSGPPRP